MTKLELQRIAQEFADKSGSLHRDLAIFIDYVEQAWGKNNSNDCLMNTSPRDIGASCCQLNVGAFFGPIRRETEQDIEPNEQYPPSSL